MPLTASNFPDPSSFAPSAYLLSIFCSYVSVATPADEDGAGRPSEREAESRPSLA
jgi:hypothetical protein